MSMTPYFPALRPVLANHIWFDIDGHEDEHDVAMLEKDNNNMLNKIANIGADLHPLGRIMTLPGQETDDDEDGNDDTDSDSHDDEEDDEIDRLIVDSVNSNRTQMVDPPYSPAPDEQNAINEFDHNDPDRSPPSEF